MSKKKRSQRKDRARLERFDVVFNNWLATASVVTIIAGIVGVRFSYTLNHFVDMTLWVKAHLAYGAFVGLGYWVILATIMDRDLLTNRGVSKYKAAASIVLFVNIGLGCGLILWDPLTMVHREYFNYSIGTVVLGMILARLSIKI